MMRQGVEHVAVRVRDLNWHLRFFEDVLGMAVTEMQMEDGQLQQVWIGGIQLTQDKGFQPHPYAEESIWHVGVHVADIAAALERARSYSGVSLFSDTPAHQNWFVLPEGLVIELVNKSHAQERK